MKQIFPFGASPKPCTALQGPLAAKVNMGCAFACDVEREARTSLTMRLSGLGKKLLRPWMPETTGPSAAGISGFVELAQC